MNRFSYLHKSRSVSKGWTQPLWGHYQTVRWASNQKRQHRDDIWVPTVNLNKQDGPVDATQLLTRAGYLRQAYSGIYHMLPLGLRVQQKLESLIDKHMESIKASKISLSSLSSQALWQKTGRLNTGSEFFRLADRKDMKWILAPTHEEEITKLVADTLHSPGQLPIRLYQISRKYRDEKRPRGGLLRGREFIMKDLYTFDISQNEAHIAYENVRVAYRNFLDELKIKYIEARADSGSMGGTLSHEYHFPSTAGEDDVIACNTCDYARNEEWVPASKFSVRQIPTRAQLTEGMSDEQAPQVTTLDVIDRTQTCLVKAFAPYKTSGGKAVQINTYAVKAALAGVLDLDTGVEQPRQAFAEAMSHPTSVEKGTIYYLFDPAISKEEANALIHHDLDWVTSNDLDTKMATADPKSTGKFSLLKQTSGDSCPQCQKGSLKVEKAIEIGHTFHLGTRYSSRLDLKVKPLEKDGEETFVQMGCHGIGISRLVAAVAASLSDETGLNWPRAIAPFEAVVIVDGNDTEKVAVATRVYDALTADQSNGVDTLLDDRSSASNGYKLKDADMIGYPIILIIGKTWQNSQQVEIQCRRLGVKESVGLENVSTRVQELLAQI